MGVIGGKQHASLLPLFSEISTCHMLCEWLGLMIWCAQARARKEVVLDTRMARPPGARVQAMRRRMR